MTKITIEQMLEAGLHFGHQVFRWNPKMKPYIFDDRDGVHIIDLVQTEQKLNSALNFIEKIAAKGESLLIVGTKRQARGIIEELGRETNLPFVATRWPGGLLTNFQTIKKRISYFKKLREKFANKDFGEMTKKEIGVLEKELHSLEDSFGGLDNLTKLPGALFIVDLLQEKTALREAIKLNIPVIAMVDTNVDPSGVEFVIPANDDARNGIMLIAKALTDTFKKNFKVETPKEEVSKDKEAKKKPKVKKEEKIK